MKISRKEYDCLVVGELNVDLILNNIQKTPEIGKEVFARDMSLTLGSSSAIFANNLSVWGAKVAFMGKLGKDLFSEIILSTLKKSNVNVDHIIISKKSKTGATIAMNYGDDRAMVTYPGAMSELKEMDISDDLLGKAKHLHISSIFLQEALLRGVEKLFKRAKDLGLTTSLDTQWDPNERWDIDLEKLLPFVDVFMPNKEEIINMTKTNSIKEAYHKIKEFSNIIVVKDSINGSYLFNKNKELKQAAFLNNSVVDAIGAGDSFNAGFLNEFINKSDLEKCLKFGAVSGAINTKGIGGTGAFSSKKEILDKANEILKTEGNSY